MNEGRKVNTGRDGENGWRCESETEVIGELQKNTSNDQASAIGFHKPVPSNPLFLHTIQLIVRFK